MSRRARWSGRQAAGLFAWSAIVDSAKPHFKCGGAAEPKKKRRAKARRLFQTNSLRMLSRFLLARLVEALAHTGEERPRVSRRRHLTLQHASERDVLAVEGALRFVILLDDGAVQVETGEQTARARVGQHARFH